MAIERRVFLAGLGAAGMVPLAPAQGGAIPGQLYAAARRSADGNFAAAIVTADGQDVRSVKLPGRGHDIAVCPLTRRCVAFARRPGSFAVAFAGDRDSAPTLFEAPRDRHFYGHGVFSPDGRLLYATENDFEAGRGVVGIYDATAEFRRLGEISAFGIGPHDLALIEGGRVLVIANGGLKEHPDLGRGRRILNLEAIRTSLVYIDTATGDLLEQHQFSAGGRISLRHLDVGSDDTVVIGGQVVTGAPGRGDESGHLIYRHRRQQRLAATRVTTATAAALAGYVSSVAVDASGEIAAFTSSKSGSVVVIEIATGRLLATRRLVDVSGIARTDDAGEFLLTSGAGMMAKTSVQADRVGSPISTRWNWDNHAIRV